MQGRDTRPSARRAYRTAIITELWNIVASGGSTTLEQRARCRLAAIYAGDSAAGDGSGVLGGRQHVISALECWRDLHTVGQTVTIAPGWYPIGGRVYLGMDPGPRLR